MNFSRSGPGISPRIDNFLRASNELSIGHRSVFGLVAVALMLAGCGSTSTADVGPSPIGPSPVSPSLVGPSPVSPSPVGSSPVRCLVSLSSTSIGVGADDSDATVAVVTDAECAWTASEAVTWISQLSPASGQGSGQIGFQVTANGSPEPRQGDIEVNGIRFQVLQAAATCAFQLSASTATVSAAGGSQSVTVTGLDGCAWSAASEASWISVGSGSTGSGNGAVTLQVAPNPGATRSGTLTIAGHTFTVAQDAVSIVSCTPSIQPTSQSIAAAGGIGSSSVTSNTGCAWTVASNAPWITVTSGASGSGNGPVTFALAANTGANRSGTLTIAGHTFTVNQANGCSYSIQATSQSIASGGGPGSSAVTSGSGCAWTATSNAPWITVTSGATGSGDGDVTFGIAPNPGAERSGTLTIAGQTFTVNQATGCSYSIQSTSQSIASGGGPGTSAVTSCRMRVDATSNAPWITVTSGATGSGNGNVTFSIGANTGAARTGTLTIAGQTFTVNQTTGCSYSIQPTSQSIASGGGPGSSAVTSNSGCAWTTTSNATWITVTTGATGSGNGNVTFSIGANTGAARSGTATIAGQTFTVNQASGCFSLMSPPSQSIGAAGGLGSTAITSGIGCTWTATSNDPWITVTAGATHTGSGTVTFSSGANTGPARTGTLSIAGQIFTVNQAQGN